MLSCADAEYSYRGQQFEVAVLLDGEHPGGVLPGPIPGARTVAGHPQIVNVDLGQPSLDLTARRMGNAWLVVRGGRAMSQRLGVLAALAASAVE